MTPTNESDLAEAIRSAKGPLQIKGGGTRPVGQTVDGTELSMLEMRGIALYDPGALTLVVAAGTPVTEVEAALAAEGQRLAFEPMDHRQLLGTNGTPTMGGVAAANVSGPRRIQVGAARDFMLGVRFVDGAGNIVKNGGRVMKNVTGYDLVKLMAGSRGTLGVLTEIALKVLPVAERWLTLKIEHKTETQAVTNIAKAMGSPYEITGAAHQSGTTYLRIEGTEASTAYRSDKLKALLGGDIVILEDQAAQTDLWAGLRDVVSLAKYQNVWRVSVTPSQAPALLASLRVEHEIEALMDWAGGLVWLGANGDAKALHTALQAGVLSYGGGHATLIKATDADRRTLSVFQSEAAPIAALSYGLRQQFDPRGILNTGLMG